MLAGMGGRPRSGAGGEGQRDLRDLPRPVECLAFALRTGQVHGIWGGMTEHERAAVRPVAGQAARW
jgi:hypothetical protein